MERLVQTTLLISSPSFDFEGHIPAKFTCDGEEVNPHLTIRHIPEETKSLALIMDDPDAPGGVFDHWLVWNIPPQETITENSVPGIQGKNGAGKAEYHGPCPPSGTHRYFFNIFALDTLLDLKPGATKKQLEDAMQGHIVGTGELIGLYSRE